jgi:hypothetical protein
MGNMETGPKPRRIPAFGVWGSLLACFGVGVVQGLVTVGVRGMVIRKFISAAMKAIKRKLSISKLGSTWYPF